MLKILQKLKTLSSKHLYIDTLTLLPNREQLLLDSNDENSILFLINIDGFKEINDFYGNDFGNFILKSVAEELSNILDNYLIKNAFKLYKMPADEFAILFNQKLQEDKVKEIASKINSSFEKKMFGKDGFKLYISISIGIGSVNKTDNIAFKLLSNTNLALKQAKEEKKDFAIFNLDSNKYKEYENNIKWTKKIKEAIQENRVHSFFQPIYNVNTKKIEKYESLIRIIDHNGEIISPFFFLEISKKNRLYNQLTKIVVENSFKKIEEYDEIEVSINLSTQDIMNQDMRKYIYKKLENIKNPERIVFEILESESINNYEIAMDFILKVKKYGVKIAIDDFGSGFSNFDYILKLNIDYLKIDGSLIKNINTDINAKIIIETIISFCKKMNIKTVAEFVSSEEIFNSIKELGIDYVQGYYIGKPESDFIKIPEFEK